MKNLLSAYFYLFIEKDGKRMVYMNFTKLKLRLKQPRKKSKKKKNKKNLKQNRPQIKSQNANHVQSQNPNVNINQVIDTSVVHTLLRLVLRVVQEVHHDHQVPPDRVHVLARVRAVVLEQNVEEFKVPRHPRLDPISDADPDLKPHHRFRRLFSLRLLSYLLLICNSNEDQICLIKVISFSRKWVGLVRQVQVVMSRVFLILQRVVTFEKEMNSLEEWVRLGREMILLKHSGKIAAKHIYNG